ncbi:copper chaperone PCu(A)C [Devosia ginsengisoli]|uniref:copper chaperone PCu(A)C n=1 Tax=Devosia ginsengisoli TaxID=400770 RepID=UPI0026F18C96|nr:copper chaperone PCu(A)C [Devosia ginsengisoli]MCR6670237.1 copper chaperone PCu(A)C [Devosia ginsengisoli]
MIKLLRAALAAAILVATPAFAHNGVTHLGDINISLPFTRATLPNAPVAGGFLTIENAGTEPDRLISVTSDIAGETQIHEMAMQGDVMKMRPLADGLEIPAGETVVLAPGGFHIMFMGLKQTLVEGETVAVTLTFEKAGSVEILLPVEGAAADAPTAMEHAH